MEFDLWNSLGADRTNHVMTLEIVHCELEGTKIEPDEGCSFWVIRHEDNPQQEFLFCAHNPTSRLVDVGTDRGEPCGISGKNIYFIRRYCKTNSILQAARYGKYMHQLQELLTPFIKLVEHRATTAKCMYVSA